MTLKATIRNAGCGGFLFLLFPGCSYSPLSSRKFKSRILVALSFWMLAAISVQAMPNASANPNLDTQVDSSVDNGELELESDVRISTAGFYQLTWNSPGPVALEEYLPGRDDNPVIIYEGPDMASVISGKPDGKYLYRIRLLGSSPPQYSNAVKVFVKHHSLEKAFSFFLVGALVFVSILFVIFKGRRLTH